METSSYYTPDISEFYVGFEYVHHMKPQPENNYDGVYNTRVFNTTHLALVYNRIVAKEGLSIDEILIKYLDKQDIESLGFIDLGSMWFFKQDCLTVNGENFLNCKIRMWTNNQLDIYADYKDNDELQLIFRGVIKNKSELVKVLKMIGVV